MQTKTRTVRNKITHLIYKQSLTINDVSKYLFAGADTGMTHWSDRSPLEIFSPLKLNCLPLKGVALGMSYVKLR